MLRLVPPAVLILLLVPIAAGALVVIVSAFGWSPGLNEARWGFEAFSTAFATPGFWRSVTLSLQTGLGASLISFAIAVLFTAAFAHTKAMQTAALAIRPVLAVPHTAAAFGLAFLVAPSGFLVRMVSPELSGFARPPDWLIINDPSGWAMLAGLVIKEVPFLMFVILAALPQTEPRLARVASSLGYGRMWGWLVSIFPAIYHQIRFPIFAVIAFATSTVDVAIVLGPVAPPPLAVRVLLWFNDPEISMRLVAGAGALVQLGVTFAALLVWWLGEKLVATSFYRLALSGRRLSRDQWSRTLSGIAMILCIALVMGGLVVVALWSFAGQWRFPDALPATLTSSGWMDERANLIATAWRATIIAVMASGISLALVLACLENEYRADVHITSRAWLAIYLPLLLPQIAFLGGLALLMLYLRADGTLWAVVMVHIIFTFPYVYLTLADPWNSFDTRYLSVSRALGKSLNRTFWTIRMPMLLTPILAAFALGFAISIAQYLPTLLVGAGRQPTVTTEAVALASGGNRRLIGIYALIQTLLPFFMFALTLIIPSFLWRNRTGLQPGRQVR